MKVKFEGGSLDAAVQAADKRKRERDAVVEQAAPATIDRLDPAALKCSTPPATREFDCGALSADHAKLAAESTTVIETSEKQMVDYGFTMSFSPRNNAAKTRVAMPPGRPFHHGNPGRPKGSRNKLGEAFLNALHADWQEHGADVIAKVRQGRPQDYLKVGGVHVTEGFERARCAGQRPSRVERRGAGGNHLDWSGRARKKSGVPENRQQQERAMRFQKGQSGNPGGRPRVLGDVQELARQHTVDAVDTLANIMLDEKAAPAARVAAANAILDRGYGKPAQHLTGEVETHYVAKLPEVVQDADEWVRLYAPKRH